MVASDASLVLVVLAFCLQLNGGTEISNFLRNYSESVPVETEIDEWRTSFKILLETQSNEILQDESVICDVIRSSSMLISNSLKIYFSSGYGDALHISKIPSRVCPWSNVLLEVLCDELNEFVRSAVSKPVCKGHLSPLEYAVKLHNVDAVRLLLQFSTCTLHSHSRKLLVHLAAVKQDKELMAILFSSGLLTDNSGDLCEAYSTTYYVCALGLGCEVHKLIESYLGVNNCSLLEPLPVIDKLLSHHNSLDDVLLSVEAVSTGGWYRSSKNMSEDGSCEIPVIDIEQLSRDDFKTLENMSIPVLMKGGLLGSPLFEEWSKNNLKEKYGHLEVTGGSIPYGEVFGEFSGVSTITEFLQYMTEFNEHHQHHQQVPSLPLYIFDTEIIPEHFAHHVEVPGSGAPFHFHCNAVNSLVYGRKRWHLYPPGKGYYSKIHPLKWKHDGKQLTCVQYAGDIIFVPSGWSHSTVNIDDCIGHAIEFDTSDC